ncbi:MAG: hypothetical protein ACP6IY_14295 [Promethearchaeia archaeon]
MSEVLIFSSYERIINIWTIILLVICSFRFLYKFSKEIEFKEKILLFGLYGLFSGLTLMKIFFYIGDFFIRGKYYGHDYYGDLNNIEPFYYIIIKLGFLSFFLGTLIYFLIIKSFFEVKVKYIPITVNTISLILLIILTNDFVLNLCYFISVFNFICVIFNIVILIKRSSNEYQGFMTLFSLGIIYFSINLILYIPSIRASGLLHPIIISLISFVGALISYSFSIINPKFFLKKLFQKVVLMATILSFILTNILFLLIREIVLINWFEIIIILSIEIMFLMLLYVNIKNSNILKTLKKIKETKNRQPDFLRILLKPREINKNELEMVNKKKICVICKNKLGGSVFICPKCRTIYCKKCFDFISDKENICWICKTPLNKNKPYLSKDNKFNNLDKMEIKKIPLMTIIDDNVIKRIEKFQWEPKEKEEFIKYILSISPERRNEILDEMEKYSVKT